MTNVAECTTNEEQPDPSVATSREASEHSAADEARQPIMLESDHVLDLVTGHWG